MCGRKQAVWMVGFLFGSLILLYHFFAFAGFFGYDDLQYAEVAVRMTRGVADWSDHFSFRWGVTLLAALSYKLLGINDVASSLPALLISLATLALVTGALRRHSPWIVAGAAALLTLNHWSLFYSDKLMPDVFVAFFITAAILIYFRIFCRTEVPGTAVDSPPSPDGANAYKQIEATANTYNRESETETPPSPTDAKAYKQIEATANAYNRESETETPPSPTDTNAYMQIEATANTYGGAAPTQSSRKGDKTQILSGVAFALSLLGAFLSKETVILAVPLLAWWAVRDLVNRRRLRFWSAVILPGILLLAGYFLLTDFLTGDPAARWKALLDNRYVSFCDYASQPLRELLARISSGLVTELTHQGMMAGVILSLPALFLLRKHQESPALRFFSSTALILLLSANFMTITPLAYNPMCPDPRHYLFLIPVFAISGALSLEAFHHNRPYWILTLAFSLLAALLILPVKSISLYEQILPLAGLALLLLLFLTITGKSRDRSTGGEKISRRALPLAILLLIAILAVKPLRYAEYARQVDYAGQKEFVMKHILKGNFVRVITDDVQKRLIRYYQGFRETHPEPLNWEEATLLPDNDTTRTALLINGHTAFLSGERPGRNPWFATHPEQMAVKIAENEKPLMTLYSAPRWHNPRIVASFRHDYEKEEFPWNGGRVITAEAEGAPAYGGNHYDHPEEFSATFRIPVDSLDISAGEILLVTCRLQLFTRDRTEASVVVSAPGKEGKELWQGFSLFPQVRAFNVWSPVTVHALLETGEMAPEAELAVYLWNLKRDDIYIDDWEVILAAIQSPVSEVE